MAATRFSRCSFRPTYCYRDKTTYVHGTIVSMHTDNLLPALLRSIHLERPQSICYYVLYILSLSMHVNHFCNTVTLLLLPTAGNNLLNAMFEAHSLLTENTIYACVTIAKKSCDVCLTCCLFRKKKPYLFPS